MPVQGRMRLVCCRRGRRSRRPTVAGAARAPRPRRSPAATVPWRAGTARARAWSATATVTSSSSGGRRGWCPAWGPSSARRRAAPSMAASATAWSGAPPRSGATVQRSWTSPTGAGAPRTDLGRGCTSGAGGAASGRGTARGASGAAGARALQPAAKEPGSGRGPRPGGPRMGAVAMVTWRTKSPVTACPPAPTHPARRAAQPRRRPPFPGQPRPHRSRRPRRQSQVEGGGCWLGLVFGGGGQPLPEVQAAGGGGG
mmetsp:Transcript_43767/g.136903  ORF Transcript_43767/g.136903 Transcript_43767/m.136903 type:complete len:256 (-) Transcript_43767:95-862(-)